MCAAQIDNDAHCPGVRKRRYFSRNKWVEDESLADASFDELKPHYHRHCEASLPVGLQHVMFFL